MMDLNLRSDLICLDTCLPVPQHGGLMGRSQDGPGGQDMKQALPHWSFRGPAVALKTSNNSIIPNLPAQVWSESTLSVCIERKSLIIIYSVHIFWITGSDQFFPLQHSFSKSSHNLFQWLSNLSPIFYSPKIQQCAPIASSYILIFVRKDWVVRDN